MSKYTKIDCVKQIPLKYNDKIRASNRNWTRVEVDLKQYCNTMFEISGEFPTFISSISKDLSGVDIKVGDNIMIINGQNVSRASAKSVKKILKSSTVISMTLSRPDEQSLSKLLNSQTEPKPNRLNGLFSLFKKNIACMTFGLKEPKECVKNEYAEEKVNYCYTIESQSTKIQRLEELSDCGYYSIPRTATTTSSGCSSAIDLESNVDFKDDIIEFLNQIQQAIDNYVRPSIMLKVLTIEQSLELFQNIEKLIPVTKFLDNIINSIENNSINYSSLKIVFDAFKVYLNGLPNSITLLEELTNSNDKFVKFIDNIGETVSFKIMDLLFMPLKFVQSVVDHLNSLKLNGSQILDEMTLYIKKTYATLEEKYETDSITQVSNCSDLDTSDLESASHSGIVSLLVKVDGSSKWEEAELLMAHNKIDFLDSKVSIDLNKVINTKQSKSDFIFLVQTLDKQFYALQFHSEELRDLVFEKVNQLSQQIKL